MNFGEWMPCFRTGGCVYQNGHPGPCAVSSLASGTTPRTVCMSCANLSERLAAAERERDEWKARRDGAMSTIEGLRLDLAGWDERWMRVQSELQDAEQRASRLEEALAFYANPATYHAVSFLIDPPDGGWSSDFDSNHGHEDYSRAMPGKRARAALAEKP